MKHVLILLFALGITMAATTTALAQDNDKSDDSASEGFECRPLLTPEGAEPDTSTCVETQGQIVANYRGGTILDIDRFEKTAEAKASRRSRSQQEAYDRENGKKRPSDQ